MDAYCSHNGQQLGPGALIESMQEVVAEVYWGQGFLLFHVVPYTSCVNVLGLMSLGKCQACSESMAGAQLGQIDR